MKRVDFLLPIKSSILQTAPDRYGCTSWCKFNAAGFSLLGAFLLFLLLLAWDSWCLVVKEELRVKALNELNPVSGELKFHMLCGEILANAVMQDTEKHSASSVLLAHGCSGCLQLIIVSQRHHLQLLCWLLYKLQLRSPKRTQESHQFTYPICTR